MGGGEIGFHVLLFPDSEGELVPSVRHHGAGADEKRRRAEAAGGQVALWERYC